jgi:ABC-type antimicrobial peptide transport system permease subunit
VGVARNGKYKTLGEEPVPFVYLSFLQHYAPEMTLHARTTGDPESLRAATRAVVQALDKNLPVYGMTTLAEHMGLSLLPARMAATLLGIFGLLALLLASIGVYGVLAYTVASRTREIGVRMALGAQRRDVLRLVVRQGLALTLAGMLAGLGLALAATQSLSSLLYGVSASDPATFVAVSALLTAMALLASYLPARRASKADPIIALRYE